MLRARAARTPLRGVIGGAFLIGLAANYLGPSEHIHLLYNPLVALILWNLGVYVVVAVLPPPPPPPWKPSRPADAPGGERGTSCGLLEVLVPALAGVHERFERGRDTVRGHAARGRRVTSVAR